MTHELAIELTLDATAEVEANLWHTARNRFIYSEEERVPAVYEQNAREAKRGLAVFERALKGKTWLVEDRFSVTDIFVGYAVVWARVQGMTAELPNVTAYAERMLARPLCTYREMGSLPSARAYRAGSVVHSLSP